MSLTPPGRRAWATATGFRDSAAADLAVLGHETASKQVMTMRPVASPSGGHIEHRRSHPVSASSDGAGRDLEFADRLATPVAPRGSPAISERQFYRLSCCSAEHVMAGRCALLGPADVRATGGIVHHLFTAVSWPRTARSSCCGSLWNPGRRGPRPPARASRTCPIRRK